MSELLTNQWTTRINEIGGLPQGQTTCSIADPSGWPASGSFRVKCDQEIMQITAVSGTLMTMVRGTEGTEDTFHASGAPIYNILSAEGLDALIASITVGPTGPTGPAGTPGSVWHTTVGHPGSGVGVDGDFDLDSTDGDVFQKVTGTWNSVLNITGPSGANGTAGTQFRDGSGVPSNSLGINGDLYLNVTNGDVYEKAAGVYTVTGNIKGATGATGAAGAAGATNINTGAIGAEPGSQPSGALYLPNNGYQVERFNGSNWIPFGPLFPLIAPINANYSWVNQGAATLTNNGVNGVVISAIGTGGTSAHLRVKSTPSTPYILDVCQLIASNMASTAHVGICWRESSSGKFESIHLGQGATGQPSVNRTQWTNATTIGTNNASSIQPLQMPIFLRLADDGTNRTFAYSCDGQNFIPLFVIARTTFITPDQFGFFFNNGQSSAQTVTQNIIHWREH